MATSAHNEIKTHLPVKGEAIRVDSLSKCYNIYDKPTDLLRQYITSSLRALAHKPIVTYHREFWALKDINFSVARGETLGIVGRNGSGKSTLLQLICGTLTPSTGTIVKQGRVAALLELGSGFNPEFTGLENVYLNATLLGLTNIEIRDKLDDILSFADIGEFINQPIKTYSSGMVMRLAFSVQAQIEPDILIVDEALAVGDAKFQAKCFDKLAKLKDRGTTILLVSHSSEQIVTHCNQAILLDKGAQIHLGKPRHVVNLYNDLLFGKSQDKPASSETIRTDTSDSDQKDALSFEYDIFHSHPGYNQYEYRWGDGAARILDYSLATNSEQYPSSINSGETINLGITVKFLQSLVNVVLGITIKTKEGVTIYGTNSDNVAKDSISTTGLAGSAILINCQLQCTLTQGDYFISLGIASRQGNDVTPHDRRYDAIHFTVKPTDSFSGLTNLGMIMRLDRTLTHN